jgi:hypothetical protein
MGGHVGKVIIEEKIKSKGDDTKVTRDNYLRYQEHLRTVECEKDQHVPNIRNESIQTMYCFWNLKY